MLMPLRAIGRQAKTPWGASALGVVNVDIESEDGEQEEVRYVR